MVEQLYAHPTWIEVDLSQFRKNIQIIRSQIGKSLFCLPVKGNGYSHGMIPIAKAGVKAGVDCLAVSCLQEGVKLRQAGIEIPILVLGAIHEDQVLDLIQFNLEFSISSKFKADLVAKSCQAIQKKCRIHLEVDTGMQRTGVRCSTAIDLFHHLKSLGCFEVAGIYSHLATGDRPHDLVAIQQIKVFKELLSHFQDHSHLSHIANSNGVIHYPDSYLDMVRPGLSVFGYLPECIPTHFSELKPCFSLKSKVSYFKVVAKGEGISYGHTYVTSKQTRIITVPIGYGDGYRRALSNRGSVLIRGKRFPIAGSICMDQFMVDVGDQEVYVGDEVVLIGRQGPCEITLQEVSKLCDTIPYEVLCLLNERIPRFYT
ncbi:MAG TPA: alanine racemase [Chlamydiales bacterium]|nr:alanine racemase [Chlamydiales bacterium]